MKLELGTFRVQDVAFGEATRYDRGRLSIHREELERLLAADEHVARIRVELARPGESARIIHVLDAVEPRVKVDGPGTVFPGFLGPPETVGSGRTHRLSGVAVLVCSAIEGSLDSLSVKEAIVDLAGPGAVYSAFSRTQNVVLVVDLQPEVSMPEALAACRLAGLRAAEHLARPTVGLSPDEVKTYELGDADRALPKVGYVNPLMHEGAVHNTYVYGVKTSSLPSLMHPNETMDGAIVAGDYHVAAFRSPTYYYQNNPVIERLYDLHGQEIDFVGMVISQVLITASEEKVRSAYYVAKLLKLLGAEGAVMTMQNGGHGFADVMMTYQQCEQARIKMVSILGEMADSDGMDTGLVISVPEADALISAGSMDELVTLPAMSRVIGGDSFVDFNNYEGATSATPHESFETSLRRLYCATNQMGAGRIRAVTR